MTHLLPLALALIFSIVFAFSVVKLAYRWPLVNRVNAIKLMVAIPSNEMESSYFNKMLAEAKDALSKFDQNKSNQPRLLLLHSLGFYACVLGLYYTYGVTVHLYFFTILIALLWFMSAMDLAYRLVP